MKCTQCHADIPDGTSSFCPVCGEKLLPDDIVESTSDNIDQEESLNNGSTMVAPLNSKRKFWRTASILLGIALLCIVIFLGLSLAKRAKSHAVKIDNISAEFYAKSIDLLEDYTDEKNLDKAIKMGASAYDDFFNKTASELKVFVETSKTQEEMDLGNTIALVSMFSLSNVYEQAYVEQSGGRSDEKANKALEKRIIVTKDYVKRIENAKTIEELRAVGNDTINYKDE